jgi:hypothetical protein
VAYDAGIISAAFYTTLVLVAVLTSQAAGAWLEFVLRRGWPLMSGEQSARLGRHSAPGHRENDPVRTSPLPATDDASDLLSADG